MSPISESAIADINTISRFISCSQIPSLDTCLPVDVLVLCGNAILPITEQVFSALEARPELTRTLVICGGIGHSTKFLYEAVRTSSKYNGLAPHSLDGLPEAAVLELILKQFYPKLAASIDSGRLRLIVEDQSTNCGANAIETRRVLDLHSIPLPRSFIVVQDPTMSLRTLASFRRTYADVDPIPEFMGCPTFVPLMQFDNSSATVRFAVPGLEACNLWDTQRFFDLVMGEIPRLRDDETGYGPKGKGFIAHVDIPEEVEGAWARLKDVLDFKR